MLKTDYKDDRLNTDVNENRKFNIVRSDGTLVEHNVELRETTVFEQLGDSFGAKDINETNKAIVGLQTEVDDVTSKFQNEVDDVRGQIHTNLLNPNEPTKTVNGVTCTNNGDGTYTVNGTASNDAYIRLLVDTNFSVLQNLKLVGCPKGGSMGTYFLYADFFHSETWVEADFEIGNGVIVSNTSSNIDTLWITILIKKGVTVNNLLFKPMLTTDLSATYDDYVPYTGDSGRLNEDVANLIKGISPITNSDIDTILNS